MKGLTLKQLKVLNFIEQFIKKNHYSPSYREIKNHFSFSSLGSVYKYVQTLKRKGALVTEKQCSRALSLTNSVPHQSRTDLELPFVGHLTVGYPIELFTKAQSLAVPAFLVQNPDKTYILKVQGNALNGEAMQDGDLLLVEARQEALAGELIIALINQREAIVKYYHPEGQYIRLDDSQHQSLIVRHDHILIQGIVVGLIRAY